MIKRGSLLSFGFGLLFLFAVSGMAVAAPPLPGAIFTTDSTCTGVNLNIYENKEDVYLDGGPAKLGAAGLPDGSYYVQVTEPDGTLLGTSVGSLNETPIHVTNGEFDQCYQLWSILIKASDGTQGYDDTANPGGEYKVWVSNEPSFPNNSTKTDNFKVKKEDGGGGQARATLNVIKFYDANANGKNDDGQAIDGWKIAIENDMNLIRYTPVTIIVAPGDYTLSEFLPIETNWMPTTPQLVSITLASGDNKTVEFGNLCLGPGGGLTLGFWSNKNGQALFGADDLALMVSLNLRDAYGNHFNPSSYSSFRSWLLGANALGFATVNAVMAEANAELGLHGLTLDGSPYRAYQQALKNALDYANNNMTFVQPTPCYFSFLEE